MGGLALIDNATRSATILPVTITEVAQLVPDAGPDRFQIAFILPDGSAGLLEPQSVRPTLAVGDRMCVRMHKRSWAPPKFVKSAQTTC